MKLIKSRFFQISLFLIVLLIFVTNYQPGTYLIGWDNFNSELNPWLAVTQALNAGWSNFRSFGLVAGMGYATDLWHAIFVWILSFFLPQNTIRYVFHCFILLIGALGIYQLFNYQKFSRLLSFIGALFYILNFGTVQIFGLPYEPFSIFFGLLPWTLLSWFQLLENHSKRHYLQFFVSNLLLSGAFYVQTMFIVYCLIIGIFSLFNLKNFKQLLRLWLLVILINSYWLFSQIYFITSGNINTVQSAQQTLLGWNVPYYQNYQHSTLTDFFTQKGFYLDFSNSLGQSQFQPWLNHFDQPIISLIQLIVAFTIIIGLLDGQHPHKKFFITIFFLHCLALLMSFPIIAQINQLLRHFPVIDQIFRSPFSKFTMSLSLIFSYFFVLGIQSISSKIRYHSFFIILMIAIAWPSFHGNFFVPQMRVKIPSEYFQLANYFRHQSTNARIALFPETNIYGWYDYNWGYSGSGFLWHLIRQPIVSRSYDVWSRYSEDYYFAITRALATRDPQQIQNVFRQYQINYLLIDQNLSNGQARDRQKQIESLLTAVNNLQPVFSTTNLSLYYFQPDNQLFTTNTIYNPNPDTNLTTLNLAELPSLNFQNLTSPFDCSPTPSKNITNNSDTSKIDITVSGHSKVCWSYHYDNLSGANSYLLTLSPTVIEGPPPKLTIVNQTTRHNIVEQQINHSDPISIYIPTSSSQDLGFSVQFELQSYLQSSSHFVSALPKLFLLPDQSTNTSLTPLITDNIISHQITPWLYSSSIQNIDQYLVLPQSFDQGWLAFYFDSKGRFPYLPHFLPHYQVNNWANAWDTQNISNKNIYILFWPQLLEFLGFTLLIGTFAYIIKRK